MEKEIILSTIPEALEDVKAGKIIIVVDDEDRENEGDFMLAAEMATPEKINFMMRYGRGVLCAPMSDSWADKLNLPLQVVENTSLHETPFTVTVDYLHKGVTTGVSMYDRATTIQALADPMAVAVDFARPGHINPLRAKEKGVLRRAGHTEACVDLAKMAGFKPVAALIEVVQENGEMARLPQLAELAKQFDIKIISIADLIKYRIADDALVERGVEAKLPTQHGEFRIIPFKQISNGLEHVALIKGDVTTGDEAPLVRVHSSCLTGDVFGSCRCDCGEQLHKAMEMVQTEGRGAIIYLNQEGRGIGLMSKIASYKLQQEGLDTVEANVHLGYAPDERDYGVGAAMLREIGITRMRLLTNNPVKRVGLESYGLEIVENIPLEITPNKHDAQYLKTKKEKMGHTLKNV